MLKQETAQENAQIVRVRIKSIKRAGYEDVYCLAGLNNGTMIVNGIISKNCDALRYVLATHKVSTYNPYKDQAMQKEWMQNRFQPTPRRY